jgi:hypothetical protein
MADGAGAVAGIRTYVEFLVTCMCVLHVGIYEDFQSKGYGLGFSVKKPV